MEKGHFNLIRVTLFFVLSVFFSFVFCVYFFSLVETLSYRLVVLFLFVIFISNLGARLLILYYEDKK